MPSANCFDAPTLKNYLLGRLSDEQSDVVAAHLEACLNCEATVAELDRASDTLTSGLRLPALAPEPATDDALQRVLEKVQSFEPSAEHREPSSVAEDRSPILRDYRLLEPLGSGGMGQVYKAVHTRLDRLVAVKLLPARRLGDEQAVSRFQREMRVIGQLSHPAIVQATDAGEVDGTHFLVMEYVEGCDLNTLAKACGPLSIADACEIARQAAGGLEYAHQQGIVHRDIKPSNLMLAFAPTTGSTVRRTSTAAMATEGERGREGEGEKSQSSPSLAPSPPRPLSPSPTLKILDLGLALLSGVQAPVDELTTVGQLMGTLDYMAPEQLEDSHLVGPRADIYALAATLYRLLTGFAPFAKDDRKTPLQKLRALATQAAPPIRERRADIPEALAAIIDRALCRESAARFASMNDFADALAPWCAGHDLGQLVGHVSNVPGPAVDMPSLRNLPRSHPPVADQNVGESQSGPRSGERGYATAAVPNARSGHVGNVPHGSSPRRMLLVALALLFFAALGIVITIETNKGTLIVESLREGVEVRVKKSGKMVEEFELTTGPKSARLAAGEYEIEFVGDTDGLQIQNGKFVLKRGDTVVAKVTERPKGQTVVDKPKPEPIEPSVDLKPRKPIEIVDLTAKGMDTFEEANPDLIGARKVREALQKKISVEFADLPLTDCVAFLKDLAGLELFIDNEALTEEGIALDSLCTLQLQNVRIATALKFLLQPWDCAWTIDQGQVRITTLAKEKEEMVTRWYPVGRLLPGVQQAVERMNAEAPDLSDMPQGGFGKGRGGGGFFRVDDHAERLGITRPPLGHRRACPDGALNEELPVTLTADRWLSAGLAPTGATTLSETVIRSVGTSPTGARSSANGSGSWPVSAQSGQARRWRDHAEMPIFSPTFEPLSDGRGTVSHHSQRSTDSPKDTELCMSGEAFTVTAAGLFEELFAETLPHQWMNRDGEGGTFEFLQNVLVVRQTWQAHADIEALLRLIEAALIKPLTEPTEIRSAGYDFDADVSTRKKLTKIVDAELQDVTLVDVLNWLRDMLDVQILLDREALTEEGIATDTNVSLHFQGISGELLLSRLLKPLQLDYQIEEGLLIVTTASKVKERLVTKVYDIRDLLDRGLHPTQPLSAIESATPGPWLNTDGEGGSMQLFADTLLIILQTPANHAEVAKFLAGLRFQLGDQPKVPRVIKTRPKKPLAVQGNPPNQPPSNEPKPTTTPPAKPTADNQPRYDGKSFDEWLGILDTERSPARLAEAFQALRLLHQDSQADKVVQRVLTVFRVAEPYASYGDSANRRQIVSDVTELLNSLPAKVVQTAATTELASGNSRSRKFLFNHVLARPGFGEPLVSQQLPKAVLAASRDSDESVRASALNWLTHLPRKGIGSEAIPEATKRLRESLSDKSPAVTYSAVKGLLDSEPDTTAVIDALMRLLGKPAETPGQQETSYLQGEALILLAVMGPRAAPAASVIAPFLLLRESPNGQQGFSLGNRGGPGSAAQLSIQSRAALALARIGKAAAAELPTVEEALKQSSQARTGSFGAGFGTAPSGAGFGGAGSFVRRGQRITPSFKDLLIAAKERLEARPAPDPKAAPPEVTGEMVARLHALLVLLQTEQSLLEQHFGAEATRPELRELDKKVKAAEEEYDAVLTLYNEQRRPGPRTSFATPPQPKPKPVDPPKYLGKTLAEWIDQSMASLPVQHEPILALVRDASQEDLEPELIRCLKAFNTERSAQGLKTNAQILGLIGRKHFADRVTQTFLDLLHQRFEEELRKQGPELKSDKQLNAEYQGTFAAVVVGLRELSPNIVGPLLQRELKEGSLSGRNLALTHVRALDPVPRQSQLEQLLPLLVPFVTQQATGLTPAWDKHFAEAAWAEIRQIATTCSLNADQQRLLVDLAEKAITDPLQLPHPVNDETARSVFQVLLKLTPKSERLLPQILKLESAPRTGAAKALHSQWTALALAQLAEHDPKALPTLIRLLDEDAFSEETNFPSSNSKGEGLIVTTSPRAYAIARLGDLGPAARDALPALKKQLESKNKSVVTAAEKAIKLIEAAKDEKKTE